MGRIYDLVFTNKYDGCLTGKYKGKVVYIPIFQKPVFLNAGYVWVNGYSTDGWENGLLFPPVKITIENMNSQTFNRVVQSPELIKIIKDIYKKYGSEQLTEGQKIADFIDLYF